MARKLSTREKVMVGVLALAGVIGYRAISGDGIGFGGGASEEPREAVDFGQPPVVRMDLLAEGAVGFDQAGRNLFDYYTPPPPQRVVRKPPERKPAPVTRVDRRPPPPPPAPPQPKPPTPKFEYLGYLGPKDAKIAFFEDDNGILPAGIGDVVKKEFRLVEFKHDSVNLGYTDARWSGETAELKLKGLR